MGKLNLVGPVVGYVMGPVNVDWKNLMVADHEHDDIGDGHLHVIAGVMGGNGLPMVVKCLDGDCNVGAILVDPHAGEMAHN